jgi:hypothetical protein
MRCYFHLVSYDEKILDEDGVEVSDLDRAKIHALTAITELRHGVSELDDNWNGWRLDIVTADGTLHCSIPLDHTIH